jgi:hypothetical protein
MTVHIPPILVVIACKVAMAASQDENAAFTQFQNLEWAIEDSIWSAGGTRFSSMTRRKG